MPRRFVKRNKRITKYKKSVSYEDAKEVKGSLISQHYPRKKNQKKNSKSSKHPRGGGIVVVFISSFFFFSSLPGFNKKKIIIKIKGERREIERREKEKDPACPTFASRFEVVVKLC